MFSSSSTTRMRAGAATSSTPRRYRPSGRSTGNPQLLRNSVASPGTRIPRNELSHRRRSRISLSGSRHAHTHESGRRRCDRLVAPDLRRAPSATGSVLTRMSETKPDPPTTASQLVRLRADDDGVGLLFEGRSWTWREVLAEASARAAWL